MDAQTGIIITIAGAGPTGPGLGRFGGDGGLAAASLLNSPSGIAFDSAQNLFISDTYSQRIRKINAATGIITTVAGRFYGYAGDGGPAINGSFTNPQGIVLDRNGNLYICDYVNNRIRAVRGPIP